MGQIKWFDRSFSFSNNQNIFPAILERLEGTPMRYRAKVRDVLPEILTKQVNGAWSIQENIGHIIDLEPLWVGRLNDVLEGKKHLRPADLDNVKTDKAEHNDKHINDLLNELETIRSRMTQRLRTLSEEEVFKSALHPRLQTPMRIMDLFHFVAEHDDHHLARITEIQSLLNA